MPIAITYPQHEIDRLNREFEQEQQNTTRLDFARKICSVYSEKSETGQIKDGKMHMDLIKRVLR